MNAAPAVFISNGWCRLWNYVPVAESTTRLGPPPHGTNEAGTLAFAEQGAAGALVVPLVTRFADSAAAVGFAGGCRESAAAVAKLVVEKVQPS